MSKSVGLVIATPKNELSDQLAAIYRVSDALWSGLCPDDTLDGVRDWVEDWDLEDDLRTLAIDLDGLDEQAPYEELHQAVVHFIAKSRLIHLWQCYVAMLSYTDRDANCLQFDLEKIVGNTIHLLYDALPGGLRKWRAPRFSSC